MFQRKNGFIVPLLLLAISLTGCGDSNVPREESVPEKVTVDIGGDTTPQMEGDMNEELVYEGEPELTNPRELFATIDKDGVLFPREFHAKKGDYVLLNITNNSKEEHAIILPAYGWRTILHREKETEFGFRAKETGAFPFHCSEYCTQKEHHIQGVIYVEE